MPIYLFTISILIASASMIFPIEMVERDRKSGGTTIFFGHAGKFRLEQPIHSSRNNLKGITLAIDNKAGRSFILRLKEGEEIKLQKKYDENVNNEPRTLYFPDIPDSKDKTYTLEIIVPDDPGKRLPAGFFGSPTSSNDNGTLLVNGTDSKSLLYYRPVYGLSVFGKIELLKERMSIGKPSLFSATGVTLMSLLAALCSAIFFGSLLREAVPGSNNEKTSFKE